MLLPLRIADRLGNMVETPGLWACPGNLFSGPDRTGAVCNPGRGQSVRCLGLTKPMKDRHSPSFLESWLLGGGLCSIGQQPTPSLPADPVTRSEEKSQAGGPVRKAAHSHPHGCELDMSMKRLVPSTGVAVSSIRSTHLTLWMPILY